MANAAHSQRAKPRQRPRDLCWRWKLAEDPGVSTVSPGGPGAWAPACPRSLLRHSSAETITATPTAAAPVQKASNGCFLKKKPQSARERQQPAGREASLHVWFTSGAPGARSQRPSVRLSVGHTPAEEFVGATLFLSSFLLPFS